MYFLLHQRYKGPFQVDSLVNHSGFIRQNNRIQSSPRSWIKLLLTNGRRNDSHKPVWRPGLFVRRGRSNGHWTRQRLVLFLPSQKRHSLQRQVYSNLYGEKSDQNKAKEILSIHQNAFAWRLTVLKQAKRLHFASISMMCKTKWFSDKTWSITEREGIETHWQGAPWMEAERI